MWRMLWSARAATVLMKPYQESNWCSGYRYTTQLLLVQQLCSNCVGADDLFGHGRRYLESYDTSADTVHQRILYISGYCTSADTVHQRIL
jgi:hypothetical protein